MSDQEIINGVMRDEEKAIAEIYKNHLSGIIPMVLKNSGGEEDAKDVEQKAVIIFYQKVKKGDFVLNANTKLSTYLYSVANLVWKEELRKRKNMPTNDISSIEHLPEKVENVPIHAETETQQVAIRMLDKLKDTCRQILQLFYFERLKLKEIAQKLGIASEQTAKSKRYKCFQQYRKLVLEELSQKK